MAKHGYRMLDIRLKIERGAYFPEVDLEKVCQSRQVAGTEKKW